MRVNAPGDWRNWDTWRSRLIHMAEVSCTPTLPAWVPTFGRSTRIVRSGAHGRAAALDALVAQPQVDASKTAAIGFCFGGTTCFELARDGAPLKAIATFHAGMIPELPGDAGRIGAKVLVCHGAEDPVVQQVSLDALMADLRRDKVDWQLTYYGNAFHSFTNPDADKRNAPGQAYSKSAEDRSWAALRAFFREAFEQA